MPHLARVRAESSCLELRHAGAQAVDVPIGGARKVSQFQAPSDSGSPGSSSPPGRLGACLIRVHLERRDDTGALAAAEIEVTVAGTGPLDLVAVPGRRFHRVPLIDGHLKTEGLAEERDRGRMVPGRDALPGRTSGSS